MANGWIFFLLVREICKISAESSLRNRQAQYISVPSHCWYLCPRGTCPVWCFLSVDCIPLCRVSIHRLSFGSIAFLTHSPLHSMVLCVVYSLLFWCHSLIKQRTFVMERNCAGITNSLPVTHHSIPQSLVQTWMRRDDSPLEGLW